MLRRGAWVGGRSDDRQPRGSKGHEARSEAVEAGRSLREPLKCWSVASCWPWWASGGSGPS